jgi:hypothetical protein
MGDGSAGLKKPEEPSPRFPAVSGTSLKCKQKLILNLYSISKMIIERIKGGLHFGKMVIPDYRLGFK